ncbi:MAG: hypothetical protein FJ218_03805 [Ignavibacteria bacterium]|nr:hypothetical protein [Ignavibacteria bacterium]
MKRTILAGFLGGLVFFLWGFISWRVIGLHDGVMHPLPNGDSLSVTLRGNIPARGVYVYPLHAEANTDVAQKEVEDKYRRGPLVFMAFSPNGADPFMRNEMIVGVLITFFVAWLASWILSRSTAIAEPYFSRVAFVAVLGLLGTSYHDLINWNWLGFPFDYTLVAVADSIFTWFLAGLVIAKIVKIETAS